MSRNVLPITQDAHGLEIYEYFTGSGDGMEIVERDDGFVNAYKGATAYLGRVKDWPSFQRSAIHYVVGKNVLDIGCGAGRHSIYLQSKGFQVLGIDISPLAIRTCKLRGLKRARVMPIDNVTPKLGTFDTMLMLGNNFGLFANFSKARKLLRRFHGMTSPKARIIAESLDIYKPPVNPFHQQYHLRNRRKHRMPGQVRIRVRYKLYATPWFDYLLVSKDEMRKILGGTGWKIRKFITSRQSPAYIAIIEKQ